MSLLYGCAVGIWAAWTVAALACVFGELLDLPVAAARRVLAELRPLYLPAVGFRAGYQLAEAGLDGDAGGVGVAVFLLVAAMVFWFLFRDVGDDDRWKRRRRKVAETVRRAGARLVVTPQPAPGRA